MKKADNGGINHYTKKKCFHLKKKCGMADKGRREMSLNMSRFIDLI